MMDTNTLAQLAIPLVIFTQMLKWMGLRDRLGAIVVLAMAALFVALWVYSKNIYDRGLLFDYLTAWITLAAAGAGVFGFTRAAADAVTAIRPPPAGAAQNPTVKIDELIPRG